jgi:hypothetical protein
MEEPTKHSNIQDALNSWKAELLDLTGRNQLLYLKNYKSQIELNDLKFFNLEKFSKEVDQKLNDSEIEIDIIDYFEEPKDEDEIAEEVQISDESEIEDVELQREETSESEEISIDDDSTVLENQVHEDKVDVQQFQEVKEEVVKEVEPLGENPTPEEIAEFIKKLKDQNDN